MLEDDSDTNMADFSPPPPPESAGMQRRIDELRPADNNDNYRKYDEGLIVL